MYTFRKCKSLPLCRLRPNCTWGSVPLCTSLTDLPWTQTDICRRRIPLRSHKWRSLRRGFPGTRQYQCRISCWQTAGSQARSDRKARHSGRSIESWGSKWRYRRDLKAASWIKRMIIESFQRKQTAYSIYRYIYNIYFLPSQLGPWFGSGHTHVPWGPQIEFPMQLVLSRQELVPEQVSEVLSNFAAELKHWHWYEPTVFRQRASRPQINWLLLHSSMSKGDREREWGEEKLTSQRERKKGKMTMPKFFLFIYRSNWRVDLPCSLVGKHTRKNRVNCCRWNWLHIYRSDWRSYHTRRYLKKAFKKNDKVHTGEELPNFVVRHLWVSYVQSLEPDFLGGGTWISACSCPKSDSNNNNNKSCPILRHRYTMCVCATTFFFFFFSSL